MYDGLTPFELWIPRFERGLRLVGINVQHADAAAADAFMARITGPAAIYYDEVDDEVKDSYRKLRAAFQRRFQVEKEGMQWGWMHLTQEKEEAVEQYAARVLKNFAIQVPKSMQPQYWSLRTERFFDGLQPEIRWGMGALTELDKVADIQELLHRAKHAEQVVERQKATSVHCQQYKAMGDGGLNLAVTNDNPLAKQGVFNPRRGTTTRTSAGRGASSSQSTAKREAKDAAPTVRATGPVTCYNCGETGHIARNCLSEKKPRAEERKTGEETAVKTAPAVATGANATPIGVGRGTAIRGGARGRGGGPGAGRGRENIQCYNCHEFGHIAYQCPKKTEGAAGPGEVAAVADGSEYDPCSVSYSQASHELARFFWD